MGYELPTLVQLERLFTIWKWFNGHIYTEFKRNKPGTTHFCVEFHALDQHEEV